MDESGEIVKQIPVDPPKKDDDNYSWSAKKITVMLVLFGCIVAFISFFVGQASVASSFNSWGEKVIDYYKSSCLCPGIDEGDTINIYDLKNWSLPNVTTN